MSFENETQEERNARLEALGESLAQAAAAAQAVAAAQRAAAIEAAAQAEIEFERARDERLAPYVGATTPKAQLAAIQQYIDTYACNVPGFTEIVDDLRLILNGD